MTKIATLHCTFPDRNMPHGKVIHDFQPDRLLCLGDTPYTRYTETRWWVTVEVADGAAPIPGEPFPQSLYQPHHERYKNIPCIHRNAPFGLRKMIDNHETFEMWDHTPATTPGYGSMLQEDINQTWWNSNAAWLAEHPEVAALVAAKGVPGDRPWGSYQNGEDPPADNYKPNYYSERLSNDMEVLYLDCMMSRSPASDVDDVNKVMIGANQEARLIDDVNNSTADFVIIASSKVAFTNTPASPAGAGWNRYQTQLLRILQAFTRTGILWCCGDAHHPRWLRSVGTWPAHSAMTAGPGNSDNPVSARSLIQPPNIDGAFMVNRKVDAIVPAHVGLVEATGGVLTARIVDAFGTAVFTGTMIKTSNAWQTVVVPEEPTHNFDVGTNGTEIGFRDVDIFGDLLPPDLNGEILKELYVPDEFTDTLILKCGATGTDQILTVTTVQCRVEGYNNNEAFDIPWNAGQQYYATSGHSPGIAAYLDSVEQAADSTIQIQLIAI